MSETDRDRERERARKKKRERERENHILGPVSEPYALLVRDCFRSFWITVYDRTLSLDCMIYFSSTFYCILVFCFTFVFVHICSFFFFLFFLL